MNKYMGRLIDADKLKEYLQNRLKEAEENFAYEESKKIARHTTRLLCDDVDAQETVEAIPISYINSRISRLRQYKTYAGDFAGDLLEAIIKDYNKEAHNEQTE